VVVAVLDQQPLIQLWLVEQELLIKVLMEVMEGIKAVFALLAVAVEAQVGLELMAPTVITLMVVLELRFLLLVHHFFTQVVVAVIQIVAQMVQAVAELAALVATQQAEQQQ
jgi:hypothetical protein